ncbi:MAG TPA: DUF4332 domain-containing protein [Hyphomicrobiaceae bacterium]|nr:DUF4332 domain-containing protein [Hyphomicrobiaceae bacterium]
MNLLFHIVYAGHASGTHHKLALDSLRHLKCMDCDLWQRLFLANAKIYLDGSKAPDNEFKDFKNHVLHTRDGYWGGAPDKVRSWYQHLVEALTLQDWQTAVYCAGVLSHYYTDPLHPFHTGQSEAENNIHRAVEWSIAKGYDELYRLGKGEFDRLQVDFPRDANWLEQLVCQGAEMANGYYEKLIAHYDIQRGVSDPPAGLDQVARRIVARLIWYATISFGAVLDRAIDDSNMHPPETALLPATLLAAVQVPVKVLTRRLADAQERRQVERMYDELIATGTVEKSLSEDDRAVRDLHAAEVLAKLPPKPEASKVFPFTPRERVVTRIDQRRAVATPGANVVQLRSQALIRPAANATSSTRREAAYEAVHAALDKPDIAPPAASRAKAGLSQRLDQVTVTPIKPKERKATSAAAAASRTAEPRFYLSLDQDVVDGPSIGPKTAERLYPLGIKTVRDLIKAEPAALSVLMDARGVTTEAITAWQDQARLVCTVPGLRGTHAQLLVGAGYVSGEAIAAADADKLCADVLAYAASATGQRLLRNGDPPDIDKIKGWLEAAQSIRAA